MPPSKVTYTLPTDAPPSVLKEDGIECGFIGNLQGFNPGNGFVWHTTGSGKTLTSFKVSTLLKENDHIHKCVFHIREAFNRFQEGCV